MTTYFEIYTRFKKAWEICTQERGTKQVVMQRYNIHFGNFSDALKDPEQRKIKVEWIACVCVEFNVSADWVLTGRGKMFL